MSNNKLKRKVFCRNDEKIFCLIAVCFLFFCNIENVHAAMSYEEALRYQKLYPDEIIIRNEKIKDVYGDKKVCRFFNLLKKNGQGHSRGIISGQGERTFINLLINYGFEDGDEEPYAYIRWMADLAGTPSGGINPTKLYISFEDGFVKTIYLQGFEYQYQSFANAFSSWWAHCYSGRIKLNDVDIYDVYSHGKIAAVSIDDGRNGDNIEGIVHFFYSGDKDSDEKELLTKGFSHIVKILEIDPDTIETKRTALKNELEKNRTEKLKKEIEQEIKEEMERESMKKQILEEMKAKGEIK